MKAKRLMSATLAAVVAVSSAVVCQISASAADFFSNSDVPVSKLTNVTKATVTVNVTKAGSWGQVYSNDPTNCYVSIPASVGQQSEDVDMDLSKGWYKIGYQGDIEAELVSVVFKDASGNAVYTYDPTNVEESITAKNFTYSTLVDESMEVGDSFTITYDSENTPDTAQYRMKYVYTDSDEKEQYPYAVKEDGTLDNSSKDIVGVEVSKSTSGTKTTYTFTAVSASVYPFKVNVEVSASGEWNESGSEMYLWFGDVSYKVIETAEEPDTPAAPSYTGDEGITSAENITPGTTLVQKTAVVDGEYNARFVQKVSEDDIKDATKVVFTLSNGTDTKTVESHNYFNSLKVNGNKITVDDGYVFLSYTIKDIPAGIEVTCEGVTAEFIS